MKREGSLRQRTNGLWEARYTATDGRRRSAYASTMKEAQAALRSALNDADSGIAPVGRQLTVGAYLDQWLASSVRIRLRPATVRSYESTVTLYLRPALGRRALAKLSPDDVAAMVAGLAGRGSLSPTTVRYALTVLRIALGRAVKSGRVVRNVAALVDPPKLERLEIHPLSLAEVATFLRSVEDDRLGPLYVCAIGLGLRQGELLGLRWPDVDLEGGSLTVAHTLNRGKLAPPKTDRSRRSLRLGVEVATPCATSSAARKSSGCGPVVAGRIRATCSLPPPARHSTGRR